MDGLLSKYESENCNPSVLPLKPSDVDMIERIPIPVTPAPRWCDNTKIGDFLLCVRKFVFAVNLGLGAHEVCTRSSFEEEGEEERERRKEREREGRRDQKKESARM